MENWLSGNRRADQLAATALDGELAEMLQLEELRIPSAGSAAAYDPELAEMLQLEELRIPPAGSDAACDPELAEMLQLEELRIPPAGSAAAYDPELAEKLQLEELGVPSAGSAAAYDPELAEQLQLEQQLQLEELRIPSAGSAAAAAELPEEPSWARDFTNGRMSADVQPVPSAPPLMEEPYCAICKKVTHSEVFVNVKPCAHQLCSTCVRRYVLGKLHDGVIPIGCPVTSCHGKLDPGDCKAFLPRDAFERWCRSL